MTPDRRTLIRLLAAAGGLALLAWTIAHLGPRRVLAFCCSVAHADFTAAYFREHGARAVAVHSGPTSAPRAESLRRLSVWPWPRG